MATLTLGTNAATSLIALKFVPGVNGMNTADVATINNAIRLQSAAQNRTNGSFSATGMLRFPGGRTVQMQPGDYVAVDVVSGWPIFISAYAIANGPWTHT